MKKKMKRIVCVLLVTLMLLTSVPVGGMGLEASAANSYVINGVTVQNTDFPSAKDDCWNYANNIYNKIWGQRFSNSFNDSNNSLRNLSDSQLILNATNLKKYVSHAALGSCLRICNSDYLHGDDGWGHSQIIVQKDSNGFTVFEGGLTDYPHRREKYFTWDSYCNTGYLGGQYSYIKYIKWPNAPVFNDNLQGLITTTYPSYCTIKSTVDSAPVWSMPCSDKTDKNSKKIGSLAKDATTTTYELIKNKEGNLWYKIKSKSGTTGYIFAGNTAYVSYKSDITSSGITVPASHTAGKTYVLTGSVSTTYTKLKSVSAYIYKGTATSGTAETGTSATPSGNSYSFKGSAIDNATKFNVLPAGTHNFVVKAVCSNYYAKSATATQGLSITYTIYKNTFNVVNAGSTSKDTQKPGISNVKVSNLSSSGYTVTCNVSDNVKVTRVAFPTWTHNNGQDDLFWRDGTISGNTATFRVNVSEHKNESGWYATHIYAYDAAGNSVTTGVDVNVPVDDIISCDDSTSVNNKHYSNTEKLRFHGWAFSNKGKNVSFKYVLDSNSAVSVNNVGRDDVKKAYSSTCSFTNVGYDFSIDLSKLSVGKHTIKVTATSSSGVTKTVSELCFYVDLQTVITIPDGTTHIESDAFSGRTEITSVIIPNSVTSIGSFAFFGCTSLTNITIPDSVTTIACNAFNGCTGLKSINVDAHNKYYSSDSIGVLFDRDKNVLVKYPAGNTRTSYTIPNSVTSIGSCAFFGCTSLTNIIFPDSVTSIDTSAFYGCTGLASITIPDSVTSIGISAFYRCTSLTSITIPDSVTSIEYGAFSGCTGLTSITIPDSVTSIGQNVFNGCTNLESSELPNTVTAIAYRSFYNCSSLKSVEIPLSVKSIGEAAFYGCEDLQNVYYEGSETQWEEIEISGSNEPLSKATIHYNYNLKLQAPTNVTTTQSSTAIKLTWSKVAGADGYRVYMYDTAAKKWVNKKTLTATSFTVSKLKANTTYQFKIIAYKKSGDSVIWGEYTSAIKATTKLAAPGTIKTAVNASAVKLAWSKVAGADGYRVYMYDTSAKKWVNKKTLTGTSLLISNLKFNVTYQFKVIAYKMVNGKAVWGEYSPVIKATTKLPAPSGIKIAQNESAIKLTWNKVAGATGYRVYMYNTSSKKWVNQKTLTGTSLMIKNLKAGTTYQFKIIAYKKSGSTVIWGNYTAVFKASTRTVAPKITAVASTAKGRAAVAWSNVAGETGYELWASTKKDSGYKKIVTAKADVTKGVRTGLVSGRTYYFKVRAYKTVGNTVVYSAWSNTTALKVK